MKKRFMVAAASTAAAVVIPLTALQVGPVERPLFATVRNKPAPSRSNRGCSQCRATPVLSNHRMGMLQDHRCHKWRGWRADMDK